MNYQKLLQEAVEKAIELDKEEGAVVLLLQHACKMSPNDFYKKMFEEVNTDFLKEFKKLLELYLYENKPVQYLIGTSCFYGYDFIVNEDVLIPRFETEELVENILYRYDKYFPNQKVQVCDLATGSGCIGITLAKEESNMQVVATDISSAALDVARKNNQKLGANVQFLMGDMLEPLKDYQFDIFVSNPPYIPEREDVMSLVKDNEPNIALFGGEDGLKFYRIILSGVKPLLKKKAMICFEHGYDKKTEINALAKTYFPEARIENLKDLEGKDRMTFIYVGDFNE